MPPENTQNPYDQNSSTPPPPPQPENVNIQPDAPQQTVQPTQPLSEPVQQPTDISSPQPVMPSTQPIQSPASPVSAPMPPQPIQPTQPGPVVMGGPVVGQDGSMPNQAPGMVNAAPGMPGAKPKKNIKKLVIIIVAALVGIAAIAFGAMTVMKMLNGGAVNFSKTETVTGESYTIDIPKDYGKISDEEADIYFYTDDKKENKNIKSSDDLDNSKAKEQALIVAYAQSQPGISDQMKQILESDQKQTIIDQFKEGANSELGPTPGSDFKIDEGSLKWEESSVKEGEIFALTGTFTAKGKEGDKEVNLKGKAKLVFFDDDKLGVVFVVAVEDIFDKQIGGINNTIDSFKSK